MIDTDKYKGHTEGPWRIVCWERQWYIEGDYEEGQEDCTASDVCHLYGTAQRKDPTARLIADAPLILEAYKQLRKQLEDCKRQIKETADLIRDRGEGLHATDLDNFLEWME